MTSAPFDAADVPPASRPLQLEGPSSEWLKFPIAQNADPHNDETAYRVGGKCWQDQDVPCADVAVKEAAQFVRFAATCKKDEGGITHREGDRLL